MGDPNPPPVSRSQPPVTRSYKRKLPELIIDSGSDDDYSVVQKSVSPHLSSHPPHKTRKPAPKVNRTYKEDQRSTADSDKPAPPEVMILTGKVEKQAEINRAAVQSTALDQHKTRGSCRCQLF